MRSLHYLHRYVYRYVYTYIHISVNMYTSVLPYFQVSHQSPKLSHTKVARLLLEAGTDDDGEHGVTWVIVGNVLDAPPTR